MAGMRDQLVAALKDVGAIRFLCTGNAVRSPFAELYARHLGCPVPVDSAATRFRNTSLFPETRAALLELGVDKSLITGFRPQHLSTCAPPEALPLVVFGMTPDHLDAYGQMTSLPADTFLLLELVGREGGIADPVLDDVPFEFAFTEVARCVEALVVHFLGESRGAEPMR